MRDDKFLEWERECYERCAERRRTRGELRRRREMRKRLFALAIITIIGWAVIWTVGAEGKTEDATRVVHQRVTMPELSTKEEPELILLGEFRITHYDACIKCCGKTDGITATGTKAAEGRTIAVDPTVIPYGSEVAVFYDDGRICYYIAEDCGGAIKGNDIDVFVDSHEEALELGVAGASVYLVNEVK